MKRKILPVALLVFSCNIHAQTICTGHVTKVMDWPEKCNGQMAYLTDNSNDKWFCTKSEKGGSIVLSALASGKKVKTVLWSTTQSCDVLDEHYLIPEYLYIEAQ